MDDPGSAAVTAASSGGVSPQETGTGTVPEPAGGDPSSPGYDATGACATLLQVEDSRSEEAERTESEVRLMEALVKCLSGIRRGDHNRVRLAQSEKKLALRSELAAITVEKYEKEKAKEEELERQKRAAERRRKQSPVSKLDDHGQIDLYRGRTFGPDHIIRERETELAERDKETKRLQMELEILKAEMPQSRRAEGGGQRSEGRGRKAEQSKDQAPSVQAPSVQRSSKDQVPSSNVTSAAQSGCEPIRVDTSAYDQSEGKNAVPGEKAGESGLSNGDQFQAPSGGSATGIQASKLQ